MSQNYDVLVIGGGPAGLAAAIAAHKEGASVLLVEREHRLGGILKQCIHDGFGLVRFKEKLSGPEYAERFIDEFNACNIHCKTQAFVTHIERTQQGFAVHLTDNEGMHKYISSALVLATGCRERTAKQVFIHGTRPAGVFTAGTAQHYVNLLGQMVTKRCVILGSGDIGLIMARRLTLEGATVLGVYEAKSEPSGLTRNIQQCLADFNIPLHLSSTVTRVYGDARLSGVEIAQVDENMQPITGTEKQVECDALILSVGLIPENEIAQQLGVIMDNATKGPLCDQSFMTNISGVFSCGNALHVNDLVDYVSESGELAGISAAHYKNEQREYLSLKADASILYLVPQQLNKNHLDKKVTLYFRSRHSMPHAVLQIRCGDKIVFEKEYENLKPPEMERLSLEPSTLGIGNGQELYVSLSQQQAAKGG